MIFKSSFTEDSNSLNLARLTQLATSPDEEGTPLVQADLTEIKYWAYSGDEVVSGHDEVTLDVSDVIFDTLQGWAKDSVGYNFRHNVAATAFPSGNVIGSIIYKFTNTDGDVMHLEFKGRVANLLSS